jgi:hypothetical protein
LVFIHCLPSDERAASGFDGSSFLLDVRKSIIGDDNFHIPSTFCGLTLV